MYHFFNTFYLKLMLCSNLCFLPCPIIVLIRGLVLWIALKSALTLRGEKYTVNNIKHILKNSSRVRTKTEKNR